MALADYMTSGFGPLADSWYRPDEPRRADLQIPRFAYDPSVAPGLLAQAGWLRVNFELHILKVRDPVNRNSGTGIKIPFRGPVALESRVRNLYHDGQIGPARMAIQIVPGVAANHHDIGFRLAVF